MLSINDLGTPRGPARLVGSCCVPRGVVWRGGQGPGAGCRHAIGGATNARTAIRDAADAQTVHCQPLLCHATPNMVPPAWDRVVVVS